MAQKAEARKLIPTLVFPKTVFGTIECDSVAAASVDEVRTMAANYQKLRTPVGG